MTSPLIILGASARAAAQSAIAAGYAPWCIDLFADRDLRAIALVKRCPAQTYPHGMLDMLDDAPPDAAVLLTGAMENHAPVVEAVARRRALLSASPNALAAVRDPAALAALPAAPGLRLCAIGNDARRNGHRLLLKPRCSAGGHGIADWDHQPPDDEHYVQQFVAGTPIGATFAADDRGVQLLGAAEQIIGDAAFGARAFQYAGSIGPIALTDSQRSALSHVGAALVHRYGLRGLFGVDAIIDTAGDVWPIEVNPRYTASVEVIERATGIAALGYVGGGGDAIRLTFSGRPQSGALIPDARSVNNPRAVKGTLRAARHSDDATGARPSPGPSLGGRGVGRGITATHRVCGKAVVFATADGAAPDLYDVLAPQDVADVPAVDEPIRAGEPVCTVLAAGESRQSCLRRLRELARSVYTRLSP